MRVRNVAPLLALGLFVVLPIFVREGFYLDLLLFTFMYAAMSVGWNIMGGFAGYVSLGHVGFFGLGSYLAGLMVVHWGIPVFVSAPFVGLLAAVAGAGLGWISLRARGTSFVIVTLTFTYVIQLIALNWRDVTGGSAGIGRGIARCCLGEPVRAANDASPSPGRSAGRRVRRCSRRQGPARPRRPNRPRN